MKFNLKKKIIIFSMISNLFVIMLAGAAVYKYAGGLFLQGFFSSKETLARAIALSINGDKHKTLTGMKAASDSDYRKYLQYLNSIRHKEKFISYLFTLNYDPASGRFSYIVDSDIAPSDIAWITTGYFGFALSVNSDNDITIRYNEVVYSGDFDVNAGGKKMRLVIGRDGTISLGERELARVVSRSPLVLDVSGEKLDYGRRELCSEVILDNRPVKLYCSLVAKGESQSLPGEYYAESADVIESCREIIRRNENTVVNRGTPTSIYGENTATVYGIIRDSKGDASGLVVIELFQAEVERFQRSIIAIIIACSLPIFIISIILTLILAAYIIVPIKKLTAGTKKVGKGNFDFTIDIHSDDEFGALAAAFNSMVLNLKKSRAEITSANEELNRYKNNLETLVEERTMELVISNRDLHNALSDVRELKGLFPICSSCKKIRDDNGYWNQIENYISRHSRAEFTHSICPDCAKRIYPEYYNDSPE